MLRRQHDLLALPLLPHDRSGHRALHDSRNRRPELSIKTGDFTMAEMFKRAGYDTAMIGKWGLGLMDSPGAPNQKGFDFYFGYPSQTSAHDYYPPYLLHNTNKMVFAGNEDGKRTVYSQDLFIQEALKYIRQHQAHPFFLYLPVTIPHANNEEAPNGIQGPSDAPYSDEDWPRVEKNFAASITLLDKGVGQILEELRKTGLDNKTLVIFTSDNGPHAEGGHDPAFFNSSGHLRGIKRDLYEGGIRVPMIARWPGKIPAGKVSDQLVAFWDMLPTFAKLIGKPVPKNVNGVSVLPAVLDARAVPHPPLYWEFHEHVYARAVRLGDWKGISSDPARPMELYNLANDLSEQHDVAKDHPDVVKRIEAIMKREHVPDPMWQDAAG